jgi:RHS repeat-associated protein
MYHDASGNTLNDGNNRYWYDAEGQLCAVQSLAIPGLPITQYVYDAEGARIGKGTLSTPLAQYTIISANLASSPFCATPLSSGFTLSARYLVDQGGDQVTELSEQGMPTPATEIWKHSNVFSAARLTATYDTLGLHYELADPLGTKRVQANISGQIEMSWISLPFGDALTPILPTNPPSTADDATEHHFTQKERDAESGNDYFLARYYSSAFGRFTTPDWSAKVVPVPYAKMDDPQSLNLYVYVRNNPLIHIDRDGHACDSLWHCAQSFLNVVEVQISASLGTQGSVQWGVANAEYHATVVGVEGKSGLGGGNMDSTISTGVGASASASGGPAKASVSANARAQVSTTDGASVSASASGKVALGPASTSASASMDQNGLHTSVGPGTSADKVTDWKIGGSFTYGLGGGVNINFSQLGRAMDDMGQSLSNLGEYIQNKYGMNFQNPEATTGPKANSNLQFPF